MSQIGISFTLPSAPQDYDQSYMNRLVRLLEQNLDQIYQPRLLRATTVNISQLPTSSTGLAVGDLWVDLTDSNTVKIVT